MNIILIPLIYLRLLYYIKNSDYFDKKKVKLIDYNILDNIYC